MQVYCPDLLSTGLLQIVLRLLILTGLLLQLVDKLQQADKIDNF